MDISSEKLAQDSSTGCSANQNSSGSSPVALLPRHLAIEPECELRKVIHLGFVFNATPIIPRPIRNDGLLTTNGKLVKL